MSSGFTGTSLQLQLIMTAHSQWVPKTRSIPYWTTNAFSSTVTNDIDHKLNNSLKDVCLTNFCLNSPSVLTCPPFITLWGPNSDHHFQQYTLLLASPLLREPRVNSVTTLWFYYSVFKAVFTEPLLTNGHSFWFPYSSFLGVRSEYISPLPSSDTICNFLLTYITTKDEPNFLYIWRLS
jgi:hypothetical protein